MRSRKKRLISNTYRVRRYLLVPRFYRKHQVPADDVHAPFHDSSRCCCCCCLSWSACDHAARLLSYGRNPIVFRCCCRQPKITPRPFPATANFPAAECTRLLCRAALPLQTTLPVGCTRLAAVRLIAKYADMFPLVSDYPHVCFLLDLLLQLLLMLLLLSRSAHGHAVPIRRKSPFRYARRWCTRLYSHRGASALLPSFRRDTTLPACSYAFTIGESNDGTEALPAAASVGGD